MSNKTENVDVAFEMITEAVDEFSGYILGIPEGDIYTRLSNEKVVSGETSASNTGEDTDVKDTEGLSEIRQIRHSFSNICDRTNGGLTLAQINERLQKEFKTADTADVYCTMVHVGSSVLQPDKNLISQGPGVKVTSGDEAKMTTLLMTIDPKKISGRTLEPQTTPEGSDSDEKIVVIPGGTSNLNLELKPPASLNTLVSIDPKKGAGLDRKLNPSLGSFVIKDPTFGFNSRNANHLPVFLSAITPLEMSRCTPYLDVKILTKNRGVDNKLGIHNFLRYESDYGSGGTSSGNSTKSFFSRPVGEAYTEILDDVDYTFMDIFTSPQTMVNPNVNKSPGSHSSIREGIEDLFDGNPADFEPTNVRDPLQPFMSLLSFNPSVAGIGYGLLATKKASLKIKLHDKSRIKDLAPILSPNEFSGTKFVIEFGWSHPDGSVTSDNTIGRYLNALRDLSVYQLVNADYSFGSDNSVDITLNLICSGFQQMKTISAAAGFYTNIDSIIDEIERDIEGVLISTYGLLENSERAVKVDEIRSQLKIKNTDLSKKSNLIPFEKVSAWASDWDSIVAASEGTTSKFSKIILENLLKLIYNVEESDTAILDALQDSIDSKDDSDTFLQLRNTLDQAGVNAGDVIFAKLRSMSKGVDPYRAQTVTNFYRSKVKGKKLHEIPLIGVEDPTESSGDGSSSEAPSSKYPESGESSHVSLGKIVSSFIGYPMSTCGIYDEVQLFFYPVNGQSAGARKHTTASLPISLTDLEEEITLRIKASEQSFRNLSVHAFFAILERIISKQTATAYDLFPEESDSKKSDSKLKAFRKKKREEKIEQARNVEGGLTEAEIKSIESEIADESGAAGDDLKKLQDNRIIAEYESFLSKIVKDARTKRLREVYTIEDDDFSNYYVDKEKFVPINLSMFFETFSPRSADDDFGESLISEILKSAGQPLKRRDTFDNGKDLRRTVLRIHIYDENSNMGPDIALYGAGFVNMSKTAVASESKLTSYAYVKNLLMRRHPSIIHGSSNGVVNNISISSNTSGQLSNILMVEAYAQSINAGAEEQVEPEGFDETVLLPTTVNLEMMGFPMMTRGQQIFIDFGTQTSLDNLYTVKTVDHEIQAGSFKTSAVLVAANQMIVSSFRARLESLASTVKENAE